VTPEPDLKIAFAPERVEIKPGERVEVNSSSIGVQLHGPRAIDVRNLPRGVPVLNIGLNGVLVTEKQTERTVFLYAEPGPSRPERPFYAVGRLELLGKA